MKQKLLSLIFVLTCLIGHTFAQDRLVSGKVTSAADGTPLSAVSVAVVGTSSATQTDQDGNYTIQVGEGATLAFSSIGYLTQRIEVGSRTVLNVQLAADETALDEVVVTALGIQRNRRDLGYSTQRVSSQELTQVNAVNVAGGLTGKVSGLNVTGVNSGVFENVKMNLRGIRSLTGNNNPLLVVDGVPMDLNFLPNLNPNDIENVSVLKGSASAAIYGPDARNGVIVVTTKKGSDVPVITVGHSTQWQNVSFFPALQKQFGQGYDGIIDPIENWSWGPAYDGSQVQIGDPLPNGDVQMVTYSGTDERKKFYETGATHQTDVSFAMKDFFLSAQDAVIKGIVPNDRNRRTSIRLNSAREYNNFRVGLNTNYSQQNFDVYDASGSDAYFSAQGVGGNDGLFNQLINTPAHIPLTSYKDYKNNVWAQYDNWFTHYGLNPYFQAGNWRSEGKRQNLITNLDLSYKATDWLTFQYRAGLVSRNRSERNLSHGHTVSQYGADRDKTSVPASIEEYNYNETRLSSDLFAQVDKQLDDDFKLGAILGTYVRQVEYRGTSVEAPTLLVPNIFNISNRLGNLNGESDGFKSRLFSVYGNVSLNYKGWANVEFTGRTDKTSLLSAENNTYFYPGVSGALVLTDAVEGLKGNALSYLKLRAAWNKTGNADITPYTLFTTYSQPADGGFPYGSVPGMTLGNTAYSPDLKPEFINSTEVGVETGFLNDRIRLEATYFYQRNTDQILAVRVSDATGFRSSYRNAASFINKGVELDLNVSPIIRFADGGVRFRANALYNDSEITSIFDEQQLNEIVIGTSYTTTGNYAIKGQPAFVWKATDYLRDDQGRIIVNPNTGRPSSSSTLQTYGRTMPKWILSLNPSVDYKSFTLSALFEHKTGHQVSFFELGSSMAWTGVSEATAYNNREPFILPNSVIPDPNNPGQYIENTTARIGENEEMYNHYTGEYRTASRNFLVDASSWRLRELSLSYNVPQGWLQSKQSVLKSLSISLVGRNLALWLPKENKYMDPDFNSFFDDGSNSMGMVTATSNPPVRNYGFTVNAKF
ncbi:TonB-linked SusC/RagA family outer membrane protein [Sphingobacterium allocomposti]|uniref:TonB-linked SusC/RagA family outer membrane protein n=1 Tax=Sphingobacterium allocomposti TaxID=415956 RepID=A0A5S5D301_9SPHI|nr:SusC/RagA family TonB-linked outer membrane protein [Sphingobacterium composti Yoo et al. 2007 non Ten et al. 2007]TYP90125.1 TonB-linked SusC/RagA family outer membrane protein [Sphingobacterium composti Yoo et al. 2007 non Ten et al. 2007]